MYPGHWAQEKGATAALILHEKVADVAVFGIPNPRIRLSNALL
jgi:hypothetical protein